MSIKAYIIYILLKLYAKSCRIEVDDSSIKNYDKPVIFAFWHEIILFVPFAYDKKRVVKVLQSPHRDGVLASRVIENFGLGTVWGSSNREPIKALKSMIKEVKNGSSIVITPDGPKGPPRKLKMGVIELAYLTKAPIVPIIGEFSNYFRVKSWDGMIVPKPFSRVRFVMGRPIFINSKSEFESKARQLESILNGSTKS